MKKDRRIVTENKVFRDKDKFKKTRIEGTAIMTKEIRKEYYKEKKYYTKNIYRKKRIIKS